MLEPISASDISPPLRRLILTRRLEKGERGVIPFHEQQPEGARTAVACDGGRRLLEVDPLKGAILLYQILNILELFLIHPGIGNEQDAPVNISGILKDPSDISFCDTRKSA